MRTLPAVILPRQALGQQDFEKMGVVLLKPANAQANPLGLVAPTGFDDGIGLRVIALGGLQLEIGQRTVLESRPGMAW